MILVIRHTADKTTYDDNGRVLEERGAVTVSHGIDLETGKTVIRESK